ncbi:head-tail connector protein [Mesobacterium pallidum]|uniref:head-tail connector protein n=1 Tax=Mesobacterium pallidum TaxID=2872037 RepID=UPI001EE2AD32|nr:head-tail connector protein [Mesobacterium pallidum]
MMLIEETTIGQAALPVDAFKAHLRLGTGFAEGNVQDAVLEGFLRAAVAAIEARTGKILIERAFSWTLTQWRDGSCQVLPVAPVTAVTGVTLIDGTGAETLWAPGNYRLERDAQRPKLVPVVGALPYIPTGGSVEIAFDAGYAATVEALPSDLVQAVMLLAAHYYEYRDETSLSAGCMPFGVTSLIERYRVMRLFGGLA